MLRRRVALCVDLWMLLGAWQMADEDDFPVLWALTSLVVEELKDHDPSLFFADRGSS